MFGAIIIATPLTKTSYAWQFVFEQPKRHFVDGAWGSFFLTQHHLRGGLVEQNPLVHQRPEVSEIWLWAARAIDFVDCLRVIVQSFGQDRFPSATVSVQHGKSIPVPDALVLLLLGHVPELAKVCTQCLLDDRDLAFQEFCLRFAIDAFQVSQNST